MSNPPASPGPHAHASAPLRVLQLTAPGRFGGLETVVRQLSIGLARRGHDVRVGCRLDEGVDPAAHPLVGALRQQAVEVEAFQLPHRAYARERKEIARMIVEFAPHVVHTHGYHMDVVGARAARAAAVPRVATAHGFTGGGWKNRLYERLQRRSYRSAAAVIAVSRALADELGREPAVAPRVRHLQNAWVRRSDRLPRDRAREAVGLDSNAVVVGWVGRMSREKGPDVVVEALRHPAAAKLTLCMVGDGPLREALRGAGPDATVGATVVWPGAIPEAGRLFAAFDVFVLSSRTEGTPMVLFEAMDAQVPIVATGVGGVPDVIGPGEARLVTSEDRDGLRDAILDVIADPAARDRARRAEARLESEFGPDAWLAAHEAVYREAIGLAGGRKR